MNQAEISSPHIKTATAWAGYGIGAFLQSIGINNWAEASYFVATVLSACYLAEWWWKRMWRPLFVRLGWLKP
jgi:hypothetical protein